MLSRDDKDIAREVGRGLLHGGLRCQGSQRDSVVVLVPCDLGSIGAEVGGPQEEGDVCSRGAGDQVDVADVVEPLREDLISWSEIACQKERADAGSVGGEAGEGDALEQLWGDGCESRQLDGSVGVPYSDNLLELTALDNSAVAQLAEDVCENRNFSGGLDFREAIGRVIRLSGAQSVVGQDRVAAGGSLLNERVFVGAIGSEVPVGTVVANAVDGDDEGSVWSTSLSRRAVSRVDAVRPVVWLLAALSGGDPRLLEVGKLEDLAGDVRLVGVVEIYICIVDILCLDGHLQCDVTAHGIVETLRASDGRVGQGRQVLRSVWRQDCYGRRSRRCACRHEWGGSVCC